MGADHRNSRKKNFAHRTVAAEAMARVKAKPTSGLLRAEGRNASLWRYSVVISLVLVVAGLVLLVYSRNSNSLPGAGREKDEEFRVFGYRIIQEYPHDPNAFTQGLFYDGNDTFYESTGLNGKSSVRKVDIKTGKVLQKQRMDYSLFGEGLTLWGSRLLQVTWLSKKGYIYDKDTLKLVDSFNHPMQDGWGLTSGKDHIIGSDGTANIYFMDPSTFKEIRKIVVKDNDQLVPNLNELEYIKGDIWANVYQTECIARISPQEGKVTGWLLMHGLRSALVAQGVMGMDVLNGIAWDSEQDRLFVTGKLWPKVYEIELIDQTSSYKDLRPVRKMCIGKQMVWPGAT
ncbi:hypothetical protein M758_2G178400 [Ceratodon purpureus]|nr:hypothetical protein M758_2G178400 [Ceratodon purpureus]